MNKQQEPRLRFKGFTGTWEEKTLNDVSEVFEYGLNAQAVNFDGVHKYIRITDIDDESRQFLQENVTSPDVDFLKADNYKLQKGDLLFARTGASVGKSYLYNENDGLVYFAGFLIRAKLNKEVDDQFIFQNTLTNHFNRFVTLTSQRSGQPGINSKEYSEFEFLAPTLPEQTHLGLFFSRLDSQIAESRAVLEKSRQLKKAMLEKMFPTNGEKIPKIRFKGFEGAWEREILKDVVNVFDNLRIPVSENKRTSGNTPYFGANGIQDYVDGFTHNGEFVLIAEDGANDLKNYPVQYVNGKCWVNNHAHVLQGKSEILNNIFLFSRFQSMDISQFLVGGGRAKLNGSTMLEIEIEFPKDKKEQTAIGNFFRQLDETIALQSAEVEKLNQLKKGLLAAMLV